MHHLPVQGYGMAYKLFDDETGVILEPKQKKRKRTEPFLMVNLKSAEDLAGIRDLHGTEHRVLWFILSQMNYENVSAVTQAVIAEKLVMPKSQVSVAVKRLIQCGAIAKVKINGIWVYEVHPSLASRGSLKG